MPCLLYNEVAKLESTYLKTSGESDTFEKYDVFEGSDSNSLFIDGNRNFV